MMRDIRPGRRGLALTGLGALLGSLVTGIAAWTSGERAGPTIGVPVASSTPDPMEAVWRRILERWFEEVVLAEVRDHAPQPSQWLVRAAAMTGLSPPIRPRPLDIAVAIATDRRVEAVAPVRMRDAERAATLHKMMRGKAVPGGVPVGSGVPVPLALWTAPWGQAGDGQAGRPPPAFGLAPDLSISDQPASPFAVLARRLLAGLYQPILKGAMI